MCVRLCKVDPELKQVQPARDNFELNLLQLKLETEQVQLEIKSSRLVVSKLFSLPNPKKIAVEFLN